MKISQVMSKNVLSVAPELEVRKAVSIMKQEHFKELPVIDKGKLVGLINLYDISMLPNYSSVSKVKSVMIKPPELNPSADVFEALKLISETGIQGLPVVKGAVVGFVSDYDLLKVYADEFKNLVSSDVMKKIPALRSADPVGKATRLMDYAKVDMLPVIDESGNLIGVVTHDDVLNFFFVPSEGEKQGEARGLAHNPLSSEVSGVINTNYKAVLIDDKLTKAVKLMLDSHLTSIIVVDSLNKPVGLIDRKELISYLYNKLSSWDTMIHFSGLKLDYLTKQLMIKIIINHFDKIKYLVSELKDFKVYLKGVHDHAGVHNFEVKITVAQKGRTLRMKKNGYSLRETLDDALDDLERLLAKEYRKR